MQRHPIHPKVEYILTYQLKKQGTHQEPHKSVPQKFVFKRNNYVT